MKTKQLMQDVLCCEEPIVKVDSQHIDELKGKVCDCSRKRIRLCAHRTMEDRIHEMLIVLSKDSYIRPHQHINNKIESYHVIEGFADLVLFNDDGTISDIVEMGEYGSGKTFYSRVPEQYYHTFIIRSEIFVFHETTNGPFNKSDTLFAEWTPDENDTKQRGTYLKSLIDAIDQWTLQKRAI